MPRPPARYGWLAARCSSAARWCVWARAACSAARRPPLRLAVHLFVARPAAELVRALGTHSVTSQWLPTGTADPWHRDGAFFGWDAVGNQRATQERRVYMSG